MKPEPALHVESVGSGPALVLVHGWAMHGGVFASLVERLRGHFRVHVVDLPGHGHSRGELRLDVGDSARRIAATCPRALWVGWSLGGLVALDAALRSPTRVRGVALLAASPRFVAAPDWPHGVAASVFAEFARELRLHYRHAIERFVALETMGSPHAQAELRDLKARVFARGEPAVDALCDGLAALETTDLRDALAGLRAPSLWMAGRRDRLVPPAAMQWSARQAAQGRYLELNSGHAPFLEHADAVADALRAFEQALAA